MVVTAGDSLSVTVRRTGGSAGRVAIMLKTQGHTEVSNLTAESGKDFSYVNEVLTWSSGDTSSRTVEIPTRVGWWQGDDKTFRIKLTALTTAAYEGYVTPDIPDKKIVAYIESNDDYLQDQSGHGTVMVTSVRSVNCCMARLYDTVYEPPFWGYADDTLYVTVSRMGGSDGRVAVKAKTQDASTVNGITGYFLKDFDYVKEYLVWEDGDDSDRIIEIPTYLVRGVIYPRTFRLKLSALTTGEFADCATPVLPEPKVIISLEEESQVEKTHGLR